MEGRQPLDHALLQYEEEMIIRCAPKCVKSRLAAQYLHSPEALVVANVTRASAAQSYVESRSSGNVSSFE